MTIMAFYPVDNELNWDRHEFDSDIDEFAFKRLWEKQNVMYTRFYNMDAHYGDRGDLDQYIRNADDFEADYNDEELDGGFWVKTLHIPEEIVKKVVRYYGIMDTSNSHDKNLVEKINTAWSRASYKFRAILCALYDRDLLEIINSDAFGWSEGTDTDCVYAELSSNWDDYAYNYLMHIADDGDLETIINFVR